MFTKSFLFFFLNSRLQKLFARLANYDSGVLCVVGLCKFVGLLEQAAYYNGVQTTFIRL